MLVGILKQEDDAAAELTLIADWGVRSDDRFFSVRSLELGDECGFAGVSEAVFDVLMGISYTRSPDH